MVISKKKKKKSLHFDFISNFAVFSPRDPRLGTTDIDSLLTITVNSKTFNYILKNSPLLRTTGLQYYKASEAKSI